MRGLLFAQTDLVHATARITDGEHRNGMSAAAVASFAAAGTVMDVAFEQRAAEDIAGTRELCQKAVPLANDLLWRH